MPPRRRTVPAPPPIDLAALRERLSAGSIVRVGLAPSAQFPEGGSGRVRTIGDPATDGEEFLQVEVTVNGARDVLPFAPGDLRPVTRAARTARAVPDLVALPGIGTEVSPSDVRARNGSAAAHLASRSGLAGDARTGLGSAGASHTMFFEAQEPAGSALPEPAADPLTTATSSRTTSTDRSGSPLAPVPNLDPAAALAGVDSRPAAEVRGDAPAPVPPTRRRPARRSVAIVPDPTDTTGAAADPATDTASSQAAPAKPRARAARAAATGSPTAAAPGAPAGGDPSTAPRRGGRLPAVSITVSTTADEPTQWRIDAKVGAKAVVRSEAVSAARVWDMVEGMRTPALTTAVGALLDEHRRLTQARAEALAAELAGVQAELDSLPAAPHR
ncbi:hypothetical protein JL107_11685 [Nakamurella flavida]|uniref:Uncharacterized protein n=1 Tax=Nakamurella flavida TaxID=363630 RepID=A0A938YG79_9ACTN|nr:hypothetical protein [Nakamurella flavida]MBM9477110.1 hypothetical protein [Nakamurella flavida]MDP9780056.1 hypothetical protein [Nakamurella flavida]